MIQELLDRADQRGYLTLTDVLEFLEEAEDIHVTLEMVLYELEEMGIEVQSENLELHQTDESDPDFETIDAALDSDLDDLNAIPLDDHVGLYFRQMSQEPLLNSEDEIRLAKRINRGRQAQERLQRPEIPLLPEQKRHLERLVRDGQKARDHLGRANTRLVVSIAKRYMSQGLPFSDLIQEGNVGLMRAVDKYDYTRGNRFSTYATWWIRQAITRALAQKTRTIRIPLHMTERIRQMYRTAQNLEQVLGRRPAMEEIAEEMDMPTDIVRSMMDMSQHAVALERPVGEDGDSEFGDFLEDLETPSPVDSVTQNLLEETIEELLGELTPRQSQILRLRFGLSGSRQHTLEEIANKFKLSRERIRQLEKEALRRLRHPKVVLALRDYLG